MGHGAAAVREEPRGAQTLKPGLLPERKERKWSSYAVSVLHSTYQGSPSNPGWGGMGTGGRDVFAIRAPATWKEAWMGWGNSLSSPLNSQLQLP